MCENIIFFSFSFQEFVEKSLSQKIVTVTDILMDIHLSLLFDIVVPWNNEVTELIYV